WRAALRARDRDLVHGYPSSVRRRAIGRRRRTVHQRSFQYLDGVLSGLQRRHGIDVEIHSESMAKLIGHELGIDADLAGETRMRAAQDLKGDPFQSNGFQSRPDLPSP